MAAVDDLEPGAQSLADMFRNKQTGPEDDGYVQMQLISQHSIAISLKRIADTQEQMAKACSTCMDGSVQFNNRTR